MVTGAVCSGSDSDGVSEPAGYDGNGDGTSDAAQPNVTSVAPAIVNSPTDTLTLASPGATQITNVSVIDPTPLSPPVPLPHGLIDFTITGVTTPTVTVDLYVPGPVAPTGYWKYRATGSPQWLDYSSGVVSITPASGGRYKVTLTLTDNGLGDDDLTPGVIRDPGGVTSDNTGPSIQCPSPKPHFVLNQSGTTLTATATDSESGPATQTVTVSVPATGAVGPRSVNVTATDNAGNSTTKSCGYDVGYQVAPFSAPVNNLPTVNSAKAGQAIPVKWRITDANGVGISDPASFAGVTSTGGASCSATSVDAIETYATTSGLQYLGNGNWQFNWKTPNTYAGSCRRMKLNLADFSDGHVADFQFK